MSEQQSGRIMEEIKVTGAQLVDTVKQLLHEGNVRRILIKQEGRTLLELPLTVVAIGVLIAPVAAALGAFAALVTDCSIAVEREVESPAPPAQPPTQIEVQRDTEPPAPTGK